MTDAQKAIPAEARQMLERLADLDAACRKGGPWRVEAVPHSHNDGTTHFTHVRYTGRDRGGNAVEVEVASYITPDLAELLVLARNNLPLLVALARKGLDAEETTDAE